MTNYYFIPWFFCYLALNMAARFSFYNIVGDNAPEGALLWLRGVASDTAMAFFLGGFAALLMRYYHFLAYALFVIWVFTLAGNREYIGEWQSNLSVLDAPLLIEPELMRGSVLTLQLFITAGVLLFSGYLAYYFSYLHLKISLSRRAIILFTIGSACIFLLPASPPQMWAQQNVLEENLQYIPRLTFPAQAETSPEGKDAAQKLLSQMHRQDLTGGMFVLPHPRVNILVITIESLSESILGRGWMPHLQEIADNNLHYSQYINLNIITIRGLYSQFCGEETNWAAFNASDAMVERIQRNSINCLPKILNQAGYRTVYMQAADLEYQDKDKILPAMDFKEFLGDREMKEGKRFSQWGLDDPSLFSHVRKKIEALDRTRPRSPWMLAVLTVGTHHPYETDPAFGPEYEVKERAYRHADQSLHELINWMKETGRMDNTLLVITSDESREARGTVKRIGNVVTRNQGFMAIITPEREHRQVTSPYLQSDLPISILDYIGIKPPEKLGGRSLFREYKTFRPFAFGDFSQRGIYALWSPEEFTACRTDKWQCTLYRLEHGSLFDPREKFIPQLMPPSAMHALFENNKKRWGAH